LAKNERARELGEALLGECRAERSGGDVGGARNCALLASCLLGKKSVFPRRPCNAPTRIPDTAIQTSLLLDRGRKLAIVDTMTSFAVHSVVAREKKQRITNA